MDRIGHIRPTDYKELFESNPNATRISCSVSMTSESSSEMINTLFGNAKTLSFEVAAECFCGHCRGNNYIGKECPKCHFLVSSVFCRDLDYKGWIMIPSFLPGLIHPQIYEMIERHMKIPKGFATYKDRKGLTVMDWLLDPSLPINLVYPEIKQNGLANFEIFYEEIVAYLLTLPENQNNDEFKVYWKKYKDLTIIHQIPVLNEYLHLITHQQGTTRYQVDDPCKHILKVFSSLVSIVKEKALQKNISSRFLNNRMYKIQKEFLEYPEALIRIKILGKQGAFRKNCISGRLNFTSRGVIVPITDMHYGDEVYFPWEIMMTAYKSFVLNHLVNRHGYDPCDAIILHSEAITQFGHPLFMLIFNTMIEECRPYKGLPILINRNPTIRHGAIMLKFITRVTLTNCIYISGTDLAPSNSDFDKYMNHTVEIFILIQLSCIRECYCTSN